MKTETLDTEKAYQQGYADALEDMKKRKERIKKMQQDKREKRWYFIKQKTTGVVLLVITALAAIMLDGDATIGIITVPLGLYTLFSKEMMITNEYYWKTKEGERNGRKDNATN